MLRQVLVLATAIVLAPLGAKAADLIAWWDQAYSPGEDEALHEIMAAFERSTGKRTEIVFFPKSELPDQIDEALVAGEPPNIAFGTRLPDYVGQWAFDDRLVELTDAIGGFSGLFDQDGLDRVRMLDQKTGEKGLYGLPVGRISDYLHVWKAMLERAGFTLEDIPKEWELFWSFWCDQVQPAVREAVDRDDVWGTGLPMSVASTDTVDQFSVFVTAHEADYVTPDGLLILDEPEIRRKLIRALDSYTSIYLKGCTPPDSLTWSDSGNNEAFLEQRVVLTPNQTLSIPNALKRERPEDYYQNTSTIEWPLGPFGKPFPIVGFISPIVVFKHGDVETAERFIRFLVAEGWLGHYFNFSGETLLPPQSFLNQPFWLDPQDRHKMAAVMQVSSRRLAHNYAVASGDLRHDQVTKERVWTKAVHRVATGQLTPEQAVEEAIGGSSRS